MTDLAMTGIDAATSDRGLRARGAPRLLKEDLVHLAAMSAGPTTPGDPTLTGEPCSDAAPLQWRL